MLINRKRLFKNLFSRFDKEYTITKLKIKELKLSVKIKKFLMQKKR